ncbi:hypothetical protein M231_01200 [Tremella mesenterica]|uniref:Uncharacterized protein n=1 Tax=Tremella mesenterica TaxID=5217 RepID=A0A4Q1BU45_TREME|nr:hypothetical protein M231_01200 [Tremella mesenterica]
MLGEELGVEFRAGTPTNSDHPNSGNDKAAEQNSVNKIALRPITQAILLKAEEIPFKQDDTTENTTKVFSQDSIDKSSDLDTQDSWHLLIQIDHNRSTPSPLGSPDEEPTKVKEIIEDSGNPLTSPESNGPINMTDQSTPSLPSRHLRSLPSSPQSIRSIGSMSPRGSHTDTDNSSDEEGGVYFGSHDPEEENHLAKLSSLPSPLPPSPSNRPRLSRLTRVKKRDSREFLRRKTLLLSGKENRDSESQDIAGSSSCRQKLCDAQSPQRLSPLNASFSLHVVSHPRTSIPQSSGVGRGIIAPQSSEQLGIVVNDDGESHSDSSAEDGMWERGHGTESDSDKENTAVHGDGVESEDEVQIGPEEDLTFSLGMGFDALDLELDEVVQLNMGGLMLSDFSDPEAINDDSAAIPQVDFGLSETEESDHPDDIDLQTTPPFVQPLQPTEDILSEHDISTLILSDSTNGREENDENDWSIELARGGPVVIPPMQYHFSGPIRGEHFSPFRSTHVPLSNSPIFSSPLSLPPYIPQRLSMISSPKPKSPSSPSFAITNRESEESYVKTPLITSTEFPETPVKTHQTPKTKTPRPLAPLPTTLPTPVHISHTTVAVPPSHSAHSMPANKTSSRVLKPSTGMKLAGTQKAAAAARAISIRGQLDASVSTKLGAMGPPQRTVSSSSATSTASSSAPSTSNGGRARHKPVTSKPEIHSGHTIRPNTNGGVGRTRNVSSSSTHMTVLSNKATSKPVQPPTTNHSAPSEHPSKISSSKQTLATVKSKLPNSTTVPRPALVPRSMGPSHVRPLSTTSALPRPLGAPSVARITSVTTATRKAVPMEMNPLKRPTSVHTTRQPLGPTTSVVAASGPCTSMGPPIISHFFSSSRQDTDTFISGSSENTPGATSSVYNGGGSTTVLVRPVLGLPSRMKLQNQRTVTDSYSSTIVTSTPKSFSFRSPGMAWKKGLAAPIGTPSGMYKLGTPSRFTPRQQTFSTGPVSAFTQKPASQDVGLVQPSPSYGPPASATRSASTVEPQSTELRGSSIDAEDVSMILPHPSSSISPPFSPFSKSSKLVSSSAIASSVLSQSKSTPQKEKPEDLQSTAADRNEKTIRSPKNKTPKSPTSSPKSTRPKRSLKALVPPLPPAQPKTTKTPIIVPSIAPDMSEKELRTATARNTAKNEVYLCAIERQIIRRPGPRPPSPTSKIRTTLDKEEEEKKASRGQRAKRRSGSPSSSEITNQSVQSVDPNGSESPVLGKVVEFDGKSEDGNDAESKKDTQSGKTKMKQVERGIKRGPTIEIVQRIRGPGDDDDYSTPRPNKRIKTVRSSPEIESSERSSPHSDTEGREGERERKGKNKAVQWDRGLVIIRDVLGRELDLERGKGDKEPGKSCLKEEAKIPLDPHGNIVDSHRPKPELKRSRIVVTAIFYEGEEPVPPRESASTRGKKKK